MYHNQTAKLELWGGGDKYKLIKDFYKHISDLNRRKNWSDCFTNHLYRVVLSATTLCSINVIKLLNKEITRKDAGLLWCTKEGSMLMVRKMLKRGADVNCYNEDLLSPLHIATERYDIRMVKLFLSQPNINVNIRDSQYNTPLHTALDFRHLTLVPLLLENGADVNAKNTLNRTPLHLAAIYCLTKEAQLLLDHNAEIEVEDAFGKTPLGLTILKFQCPIMTNLLLKNGASFNILTSSNITMLSEAVLHATTESDVSKIRMMIRNGVDVNGQDPIGQRTSLHYLALSTNMQIARILLENGANPTVLNSAGNMPYKNAKAFCNNELGELLELHAKQQIAFQLQKENLGFHHHSNELY